MEQCESKQGRGEGGQLCLGTVRDNWAKCVRREGADTFGLLVPNMLWLQNGSHITTLASLIRVSVIIFPVWVVVKLTLKIIRFVVNMLVT